MFENPRRGRQARNFTTNVPKTLGLKLSYEQIFSENCPSGAPELILKQLLGYSAEENPCCIVFLALLISSSSIFLSLFDTQIMNGLKDTKTFLYSKREQ